MAEVIAQPATAVMKFYQGEAAVIFRKKGFFVDLVQGWKDPLAYLYGNITLKPLDISALNT
jgi:hypothetical protein